MGYLHGRLYIRQYLSILSCDGGIRGRLQGSKFLQLEARVNQKQRALAVHAHEPELQCCGGKARAFTLRVFCATGMPPQHTTQGVTTLQGQQ